MRRDVAAAALGLPESEVGGLPITPIVILSNGFGFSLEVGGCRVVDAMFLRDLIRSPEFKAGGAMRRNKLLSQEITILYSSEREAAGGFDRIVERPFVLTRFIRRISWDIVDYPSEDGIPFNVASPFRGDMTAGERERRKAMLPPEYQ